MLMTIYIYIFIYSFIFIYVYMQYTYKLVCDSLLQMSNQMISRVCVCVSLVLMFFNARNYLFTFQVSFSERLQQRQILKVC